MSNEYTTSSVIIEMSHCHSLEAVGRCGVPVGLGPKCEVKKTKSLLYWMVIYIPAMDIPLTLHAIPAIVPSIPLHGAHNTKKCIEILFIFYLYSYLCINVPTFVTIRDGWMKCVHTCNRNQYCMFSISFCILRSARMAHLCSPVWCFTACRAFNRDRYAGCASLVEIDFCFGILRFIIWIITQCPCIWVQPGWPVCKWSIGD